VLCAFIQPSLCVREALAAAADAGRVEKRLLLFVDARHKAANRRTAGQRRRNALIEGFTKLAGDGLAAFKMMIC